jgi:uncharacterized protein YdaU (DUF1376 family)
MKSPAFQLYAADIYMDTNEWSAEAVGIYTRLLFHQWVNGSIPQDHKTLAQITLVGIKKFSKRWPEMVLKFEYDDTLRGRNKRLEETRQKQVEYIEKQREKGKLRAAEMWKGHIATATNPATKRLQPKDSSSSSSSSSINIRVSKDTLVCPHQEIIKIYHNTIPELPKVVKWTTKRIKNLQTCWADKSRQSLEWWKEYFSLVKNSDFLMGKTNKFKADMEWLTIEGNLVKVVEGRYANKEDQGNDLMKWARESMDKEDVGGR